MAQRNYVKNVAIVGAGGNSGKYMAEALLATGKHTVTAITRMDSETPLPSGVIVKRVEYNNTSSLVEALKGQDALVITLGVMAPEDQQSKLIEAATEAGVPWVLPNEWAPDVQNESLSKETMIGDKLKKTRELLTRLGKNYIAVSTGFWYEWSLAVPDAYGFDFNDRKITLFDDGEAKICTSTWPQVGRAVANLLSLPVHAEGSGPCLEQFKNDFVYVSSFTISQKDMLESVLRVTKTKIEDWDVAKEPVKERYANALQAMYGGNKLAFVKVLYSRVFYPDGSGNVEKTRGLQNEVLVLPKEDLDEYTKLAIKRSEEVKWGH